ncbi:MAG: Branched-chain amino acid transport system 2 carrier protein [Chlamydiae bacterium]|nr:Branched-chain amino acid transport system 2 carrier protein [Chlamydiota bacterium]
MNAKIQSNTISTGLAMFSMFFGAGNIVYPLALGQYAQNQNFFAITGLLITAVGVPFIGLMAMTLFDGNYRDFFERIGKIPGFLITLFIIALIGPFGAMPRLFALSYSTAKIFTGDISLPVFSAISCVIVYFMTFRRGRILDILGYFLTPVLLTTLVILIAKGIMSSPETLATDHDKLSTFLFGLKEGYNTMDLMGAFFFSSIVILCLKKELLPDDQKDFRQLITMTLKAGCIGASLLALVYVGSSYVAAFNSESLATVPQDEILATLALQILGPYAGVIAILAVSLTCLTTAIALTAVFAEYLHEDITLKKVSYQASVALTLAATFFMSTLSFTGIMSFLVPILVVCYPALIALSIINLLHKLYGFKPVKIPVLAVFIISLLIHLL